MMKTILAWFVLWLPFSASAQNRADDFVGPLFSSKFTWWNRNEENTVVRFAKVDAKSFEVEGVYALGADGQYRFVRDFIEEWPTRYGHGETQKIKRFQLVDDGTRLMIMGYHVNAEGVTVEERALAGLKRVNEGFQVQFSVDRGQLFTVPVEPGLLIRDVKTCDKSF